MNRASKAAIGQGIGQGFASAGDIFARGFLEKAKKDETRALITEYTDPRTPLKRKDEIGLILDPKYAIQIAKQEQFNKGIQEIKDILANPQEGTNPAPRAGVPSSMTGMPRGPSGMNDMLGGAPPMTEENPSINDLLNESRANDPFAEKRAEIGRLENASLAASTMPGMGPTATALQKRAENINRDINTQIKADAERYKADKKHLLDVHKDSMKFDDKIQEEAKSAVRDLQSSATARKSISTGNINPKTIKGIARTLYKGSKWEQYFSNPDISTLEAASLTEYEGGRQLFGGILSDRDLTILAGKVISADKTPAQNLAILDYRDLVNKSKVAEAEIGDQIKAENGGYRPINYQAQVKARMKELYGDEIRDTVAKVLNESTQPTSVAPTKGPEGTTRMLNPKDGKYYDVPNSRLGK
jgi:hypothetical protein